MDRRRRADLLRLGYGAHDRPLAIASQAMAKDLTMTVDAETLEILQTIPGGRALIVALGGSPNFGDAEVSSLILDRSGQSKLVIVAFNYSRGHEKRIRVTFHLGDMIDVGLEGFWRQNVIDGLQIRRAAQKPPHPSLIGIGGAPGDLEIVLEPCAGAFGTIRASLTNISIEPA